MITNPYCFLMQTVNDRLTFDLDMYFPKEAWDGFGMVDLESAFAPRLAKRFSIVLPYDYEKVIIPLARIFFLQNEDARTATFKASAKVASTDETICDDLVLEFQARTVKFDNNIAELFTIVIHVNEPDPYLSGYSTNIDVNGTIPFALEGVTSLRDIQEAILDKKSKRLPLGTCMYTNFSRTDILKKIFDGDVIITYKS